MSAKLVLTRNYKETTRARYCVALYGEPPGTAIEIDDIRLTDAMVVQTHGHECLATFQNFGCAMVIVGFGELPPPAGSLELRKWEPNAVTWEGFGFKVHSTGEWFKGCAVLDVRGERMLMVEPTQRL